MALSNASVIEAAKPLRQHLRHRPRDVDQRRIEERQTAGLSARRQYRLSGLRDVEIGNAVWKSVFNGIPSLPITTGRHSG